MKKNIIAISVVVLIAASMPLGVKAHPGRTDSKGGHTNRSTGEYHYHHGYSAHDHYDMDGDGDIDCPYDFDDNTDRKTISSKENSKSMKKTGLEFGGIIAVGVYIFFMFILPFLIK